MGEQADGLDGGLDGFDLDQEIDADPLLGGDEPIDGLEEPTFGERLAGASSADELLEGLDVSQLDDQPFDDLQARIESLGAEPAPQSVEGSMEALDDSTLDRLSAAARGEVDPGLDPAVVKAAFEKAEADTRLAELVEFERQMLKASGYNEAAKKFVAKPAESADEERAPLWTTEAELDALMDERDRARGPIVNDPRW